MRKHNGHRLRKLKDRLTARRLNRRKERMARGGTWRQGMVDNLNTTFAGIARVVNKNQNLNDTRNKRLIAVDAVLALANLLLLARVLGWW